MLFPVFLPFFRKKAPKETKHLTRNCRSSQNRNPLSENAFFFPKNRKPSRFFPQNAPHPPKISRFRETEEERRNVFFLFFPKLGKQKSFSLGHFLQTRAALSETGSFRPLFPFPSEQTKRTDTEYRTAVPVFVIYKICIKNKLFLRKMLPFPSIFCGKKNFMLGSVFRAFHKKEGLPFEKSFRFTGFSSPDIFSVCFPLLRPHRPPAVRLPPDVPL